MHRFCSTAVAAACATVMGSSLAYGQEGLQQVKALYASAAYEDALSMVSRLQTTGRKLEFEQYRVYCLVALGRTAEAEKVIASVVVDHPTYVPDAGETSPRIHEMFLRIRRGLVPDIAQRMYLDARAAWNRKDTAAASSQFAAVVQLIDSAAQLDDEGGSGSEKVEPMLAELRLLASGFLDLSVALSTTPTRTNAEAPKATVRERAPGALPPDVTSPVPVKQELPLWVPTDQASRHVFRGAIRVFISDAGLVTGAEISSPIHPAYDRQLLLAAKAWTYQPALKDGRPMASEKVIEVVLKPR
jgi:hypothetical protein